jgi:putative ABC transport system substrate-binding protein
MKRREFIALLISPAAVACPLTAQAENPTKLARIGFLGIAPASASARRIEILGAALHDLGWVEGTNIVIEFRWAERTISCLKWPPSWRA